ncbi:cation-dependent mannose-6-phosphate receptor-like [Octopus sinensis]|uniref:Cation-dependent mannose-6-phosphate receptor-like n=1 Tax=Octopus sinensis TaxID=2607531 RepID=A0A6P7U0K4_9MOLL|nr:cation-dependent mannose-6-phosphate receptor-like [Octopus sinensis]
MLQLSLSTDDCQILGEQTTAAFKGDTNDEGGIYIHYHYSNITNVNGTIKNITRISDVHMLCHKTQTFFLKEMARSLVSVTYKFHLLTPYACKPVHHTLSTGSILLILFLLAFIIYLLAGFAFKHFYLGAQGVEIIPHYTFWSDFPLLVKDGCSYTFRCCRGPSAYERI